jgi:hypothetical protein
MKLIKSKKVHAVRKAPRLRKEGLGVVGLDATQNQSNKKGSLGDNPGSLFLD